MKKLNEILSEADRHTDKIAKKKAFEKADNGLQKAYGKLSLGFPETPSAKKQTLLAIADMRYYLSNMEVLIN